MAEVKFEDLLGTGAHFGHVTRKWNPNFQPYILLEKNGVHIINLESTIEAINKASVFVNEIVSKNGEILFVGTKKQAQDIVQQEADKCGMFYIVERWLGGTLTNYSTIRKSIKRLMLLEKDSSPLYDNATKKEILSLEREMIRLQDLHRGIKDMKGLPDAIFVVDTYQESIAVDEAKLLNIPVVAIVDTNSNPNLIDYPIPANDDSIRAVKLIVSEISKAICESKSIAYPEGEVSLEEAVPEEEDLSNETEMGDESEIAGSDGKQIEELVVDSSKED